MEGELYILTGDNRGETTNQPPAPIFPRFCRFLADLAGLRGTYVGYARSRVGRNRQILEKVCRVFGSYNKGQLADRIRQAVYFIGFSGLVACDPECDAHCEVLLVGQIYVVVN